MKKLPLRMVNAAQTPLPTGEADRRRRAERGAALRNPLTRRAPRGTLSPRERAFRGTVAALSIVVCAFLSGCPKQADKAATIGGDVHAQGGAAAPKVTNRIPVPQSVRDNLGITFAKIERRRSGQHRREQLSKLRQAEATGDESSARVQLERYDQLTRREAERD